MADDAEHVLLTLQRGERGELRVARCRFKGSVFTKFQLWYPGENDELKPGKCVTVKDGEIDDVLAVLAKIAVKIANTKPAQRPVTKQPERATTNHHLTPEELDEVF